MKHLLSLQSALKGKSPIAAIPVEGHAPACIDRKRLAAWSKGVTITRIELIQHPNETRQEFYRPKSHPYDEHGRYVGGIAEGPWECIATVVPGRRTLSIEGHAGRVKTRCSPVLIDRRVAIKTLSAWSEKERARIEKKMMLGALDKSQRKALKLTAHGDTVAAVTITARYQGKTFEVTGVSVTLPGFEETDFVIHPAVSTTGERLDDLWTVTERYTGMSAGSGRTAEAALLAAREAIRKAKPERLTAIHAQIAAAKLAA